MLKRFSFLDAIPAAQFSPKFWRQSGVFCAAGMVLLSGCAVVRTTADVVKTTAGVAGTVVSTTADVAKTGVGMGVTAGSAAVSAAGNAKSLALSTASVAISGASLLGSAVVWGIQLTKTEDVQVAPVVSLGEGRFRSAEGQVVSSTACADVPAQTPALFAMTKDGSAQVRVSGRVCAVEKVGVQ
jgi:hypothetical protein